MFANQLQQQVALGARCPVHPRHAPRLEHIETQLHELLVGGGHATAQTRYHSCYHYSGSQAGYLVIFARIAQIAHNIHNGGSQGGGKFGAGGGNLNLSVAVVVGEVEGDHAVKQGILALVNPGVLLRVAGEDCAELRVDFQVCLVAGKPRQYEQPLFEHRQQHVVGFGARAGELVIHQRETLAAGGGQAVFDPLLHRVFLILQHRMDEAVYHLAIAVATLGTHKVGGGELFVAHQQQHGSPQLRRKVQGKRGLPTPRRSAQMHGDARFEVGKRTSGGSVGSVGLDKIGTRAHR